MTPLEEKLINSYTVLLMAKEITLEEVPETVLSNGNTLRHEVVLEEARRVTGTVPEPVDTNLVNRVKELEETIEVQNTTINQLGETTAMQDMVIEEILFNIIPTIGGMGGE